MGHSIEYKTEKQSYREPGSRIDTTKTRDTEFGIQILNNSKERPGTHKHKNIKYKTIVIIKYSLRSAHMFTFVNITSSQKVINNNLFQNMCKEQNILEFPSFWPSTD